MQRFLNKIILYLNIVAALFWIVSFLAQYVHPDKAAFISIFGLTFLPLSIINILFIVYWAVRKKYFFLISLVLLILLRSGVSKTFVIPSNNKITKNNQLKILSQNVEVFNLYDWQTIENAPQKIRALVDKEKPDIITFQEFYCNVTPNANRNFIEFFKNNTPYKYHYFKPSVVVGKNKQSQFGVITLSKNPIINSGFVKIEKTRNQIIYTDIQLPSNQVIRVFNVHLQSIYFDKNEFDIDFNLENNEAPKMNVSKNTLQKLARAFKKRSHQTDALVNAINASPYPVIVCGDFNDTPVSYTYHQINKLLTDTYKQKGLGIGSTYAGKIPALRIDYIFADNIFETESVNIFNSEKHADHYAISSTLRY